MVRSRVHYSFAHTILLFVGNYVTLFSRIALQFTVFLENQEFFIGGSFLTIYEENEILDMRLT